MKPLALLIALPFTALAFEPDVIIDANNPVAPATVTFTGTWTNEVSPNLANELSKHAKRGLVRVFPRQF